VLDGNDAAYRQYDGDAQAYAEQYTRTMRAATEAMMADLLREEQGSGEELVNVFFAYLKEGTGLPSPYSHQRVDVVIEKVA